MPHPSFALLLALAVAGCGQVASSAADGGSRPPDDGGTTCEGIEQPFESSCYFAAGVKWLSYEAAQQLCASHGAKPVSVDSEGENSFVFRLLPPANQAAWIGLRRSGTSGGFRWEGGVAPGYQRWASGEPNNEGGKERCAVIWGPGLAVEALRGRWNDVPCEEPGRDTVICERAR